MKDFFKTHAIDSFLCICLLVFILTTKKIGLIQIVLIALLVFLISSRVHSFMIKSKNK